MATGEKTFGAMKPKDEAPSDGNQEVDVGQRLQAQDDAIREAAKWLVGSFAAVGAALIAGSQLSSIGHLPVCAPGSPRKVTPPKPYNPSFSRDCEAGSISQP